MISLTSNLLSKINKSSKTKIKVLAQPIHEGYSSLWGLLDNVEFYLIQGDGIKTWDHHTRKLPDNHYLLEKRNWIPNDINFDILLSGERFGNLQRFLEINKRTGVPIVHCDHALPLVGASKKQIQQLKSLRANAHCFVAQRSKEAWEGKPEDKVIRYGLCPKTFQGWHGSEKHGISVVNQFANRDIFCGFKLWTTVAQHVPIQLVGDNPGLSESINDPIKLSEKLAASRFFLNTSNYSNLPLTLCEAMMVGCPIITTSKYECPLVVKHGENGFLADTPEDILKYAQVLINDYDLAKHISNNARKIALELFSVDVFIKDWMDLFNSVL